MFTDIIKNPEMAGLAGGLLFSTGIFAFKSGTGQYYFLRAEKSSLRRTLFATLAALSYIAIFFMSFHILEKIDLERLFPSLEHLFRTGTFLHLCLSIGLFILGMRLLSRAPSELVENKTKAWMLLVIPCPVCVSAIFFSCAFFAAFFPSMKLEAAAGFSCFFLAVSLGTAAALFFIEKKSRFKPEAMLGRMMIFIALYFIGILLVAPNFDNAAKKTNSVSVMENKIQTEKTWLPVLIVTSLFAGGFAWQLSRKRKTLKP